MLKRISLTLAAAAVLAACQTTATYEPTGPEIPYLSDVELAVGESAVVHGVRAQCGSTDVPSWEEFEASDYHVESSLGAFSDGGEGWRYSNRCNGPVAARAVVFTATTPGSETIEMFGDPISITVTEG